MTLHAARVPAHSRGRGCVTGPLMYERPADDVTAAGRRPAGADRSARSQDRDQRMLRAALAALADEPVRVIAATNRRGEPVSGLDVPANARVVDWSPTGGRCPTARRSSATRATGRWCARWRRSAGGLPGRGRHGRERGARAGRCRRVASRDAERRAGSGWRSGGCWVSRAISSGRESWLNGPHATMERPERPTSWRKAPGVGLEPTTWRLTAARSGH